MTPGQFFIQADLVRVALWRHDQRRCKRNTKILWFIINFGWREKPIYWHRNWLWWRYINFKIPAIYKMEIQFWYGLWDSLHQDCEKATTINFASYSFIEKKISNEKNSLSSDFKFGTSLASMELLKQHYQRKGKLI